MSINSLNQYGFIVRAVIGDNHSSNVNASSELIKKYGDTVPNLFMKHPAYNGTYLYYDMVHIMKNVRNNLLAAKRFVFPSFEFDLFRDKIDVNSGYLSLPLFYEL